VTSAAPQAYRASVTQMQNGCYEGRFFLRRQFKSAQNAGELCFAALWDGLGGLFVERMLHRLFPGHHFAFFQGSGHLPRT
jgi:hypothetical protein